MELFRVLWLSKTNLERQGVLFACLLGLVVAGPTADAQSLGTYTHGGSVNPATEGWQPWDRAANSTFDFTTRPGVGPSNPGVASWRIQDLVSDAPSAAEYRRDLFSSGGLESVNWRFSALVQPFAATSPGTDDSEFNAAFSVDTYYPLPFESLGGFGVTTSLFDNGAGSTTVSLSYTNGPATSVTIPTGFNWIEMIYTPRGNDMNGTVDLFVNGVEVISNFDLLVASFSGVNFLGPSWGDLVGASGASGGADWAQVQFDYGSTTQYTPIGVPEPSTWALLGLAAMGLVGAGVRRRGRQN